MQFYVTSPEISEMTSVLQLFNRLREITQDRVGYCYYKYPLTSGSDHYIPSLTIIDKELGITAIDSHEWALADIQTVSEATWTVSGQPVDSPLLRLDDYQFNLLPRYHKHRELRGKLSFAAFMVLPSVNRSDFAIKFPYVDTTQIVFADYLSKDYTSFFPEPKALTDDEWQLLTSVSQGANTLTNFRPSALKSACQRMREAIDQLSIRIALLDQDQHAAAIQIPPGAQRIRGMAGTGKTIVLAMKAAYFHQRYPDKKILYTFNTLSLYNQVKKLITRFYRQSEERDPNWDNLMVLHAWGGARKEGVYYRTCVRNGITPSNYTSVRHLVDPFGVLCQRVLEHDLLEEFDVVLMDEAQDFPPSFYQLIYQTTLQPKRIIWAYDELQSLTDLDIQDTGVFGYNEDGTRRIDFSAGMYDNGIHMDFVLKRSYRNPLDVLMVAHGIGLGIRNQDGPLQMIDNKEIWASIGYQVETGDLKTGHPTSILRPPENNPSPLKQCYDGSVPSIRTAHFADRDSEIAWIAERIENDVRVEGVLPQEIVVVSLNSYRAKENFFSLQRCLQAKSIPSIIPGIRQESEKFAEDGYVTLSTVYRVKGNEAPVVYVMNMDYLYDYVEEIKARNMAFTAITRAKGWCCITGVGEGMQRAMQEIDAIVADVPRFNFVFPDMAKIRRLSNEEYARRTVERRMTNDLIEGLLQRDERVLMNLDEDTKRRLRERLNL